MAPAAIGGATGGEGMKIAVVDDGVDPANRFFAPEGFSYPAGFPKGGKKWTTPKVIVARSFVGTGADDKTRLALDPEASFHGTHVAGIAAGNAGTTAPAGADHPETPGLSGVAPRAQIGNYRVFNVPTPAGHVGNTPEIVAAFESAVRDGMDVINFSGGGPQVDPASDAIIEAVRNVSAAGVVPVISAGNDRDDYGLGSAGSPGTAPDAISVAARLQRPCLRARAHRHRARSAAPADPRPLRPHRRRRRRPGRTPTSSSSTSARSWARTALRCPAISAARPGTSTAARLRSPRAR